MSDTKRTIVIGVDYSDHSITAVDEALRVGATAATAGSAPEHARLVPVLVLRGSPNPPGPDGKEMTDEVIERSKENLAQLLQERSRALRLPLGEVQPLVRFGSAAEQVIEAAREVSADLISVGTHGREGLSHLLLGSVAEEVMRKAPCSVLVARAPVSGEARAVPARGAAHAGQPGAATAVGASLPLGRADLPEDEPADGDAAVEPAGTVVAAPHIDAGRVTLHVLDSASGQVFACSFEDEGTVIVEPLERRWVPWPASEARARAARVALATAASERELFAELFAEIARRGGSRA